MIAPPLLRVSSFARGSKCVSASVSKDAHTTTCSPSLDYEVRELPFTGLHEFYDGTTGPWTSRCTEETLAAVGCFEGEWVLMKFGSSCRVVQLRTFEANHEDASAAARSVGDSSRSERKAVFYLKREAVHLICSESSRRRVSIERQVHFSFSVPPIPTAKVVVLSRVKRIGSSGTRSYAKPLRRFFAKPRVVIEGDIFAVPTFKCPKFERDYLSGNPDSVEDSDSSSDSDGDHDPSEMHYSALGGESNHVPIYFKVVRVEGVQGLSQGISSGVGGLMVDQEQTQVVTEGSCHALVPPLQLDVAAAGLGSGLVQELSTILRPLFHRGACGWELDAAVLLHGPQGGGKTSIARAAAAAVGANLVELSCAALAAGSDAQGSLDAAAASVVGACEAAAPCVLLLRRVDLIVQDGDRGGGGGNAGAPAGGEWTWLDQVHWRLRGASRAGPKPDESRRVALVASIEDPSQLSPAARRFFTHELEVARPDLPAREAFLVGLVSARGGCGSGAAEQREREMMVRLATRTAGKSFEELRALLARAYLLAAIRRRRAAAAEGRRAAGEGHVEDEEGDVEEGDVEAALEGQQALAATAIGAPKVPCVRWEDVGGLADVRRDILDTVQLPLEHPELFGEGMKRRSGVLLYGPPGTGKTLLAKAVATECSLAFLSVKGPELINMYIGESERNVREVFRRAREAAPAVVFFDELDALAPVRGRSADSGGVMDRVVSQLLAELDGLQSAARAAGPIFVMGATNRPDLIEPALLRPGRFDRLLFCGVGGSDPSAAAEGQAQVLRALTRKMRLAPDVDLEGVAARCSAYYTGADLYALCADAWQRAALRYIHGDGSRAAAGPAAGAAGAAGAGARREGGGAVEIEVLESDFEAARAELVPSVTPDVIAEYSRLKQRYSAQ